MILEEAEHTGENEESEESSDDEEEPRAGLEACGDNAHGTTLSITGRAGAVRLVDASEEDGYGP